jgi:hypothetical protein
MLTKNLASSDLIKQRQARTIYSNYIIQQQKVAQGCAQRIDIQTGSGADNSASQLILLAEGAIFTNVVERDRDLSNNSCIIINPAVSVAPAPAPAPSPSSGDSVLAFARTLSTTYTGQTIPPSSGDTLRLNSESLGTYDYTVAGTTTISSFTASNWFTATEDTRSAWIIVNGNLTINSGQTFIPSVRKLFTVLYVTGNLICNGTISMSSRGANHSGTGNSGGATTAAAIRIGTGTFGAVTNPQVPATGATGGSGRTTAGQNAGNNGTNGATGGGGGGYWFSSGAISGAGATGTSFSGGAGGGSSYGGSGGGENGGANGGKGGAALGSQASGGGAGNPGGAGISGFNGSNGTGGVLIIIVGGTLSGNGSIQANGADGGSAGGVTGGGSGGGSVTVLFGTDSSSITPAATGGIVGSGGAGTARKLAIGVN